MSLDALLAGLEATPFATAVRENGLLFPWIESLHVLAITTVVGTICIVDLRLLGLTSSHRRIEQIVDEVLPHTWSAFALALLTGFLLFSSNAARYASNGPFRFKMILLLAAGLNMALFHLWTYRDAHLWGRLPRPPWKAKMAGATSLALWVGVVGLGRWIGFTLN